MNLAALTDPAGYAFVQHGAGWVGNGVADRLEPDPDPGRFGQAAGWLAERLGPEDLAFATFTFDESSDGSAVAIPAELHRVRAGQSASASLIQRPSKVRYAGSAVDEVEWMEAVATATKQIIAGEYDKIVLARDQLVWTEEVLDPIVLVQRLAARFPSCMTFLHEGFVGATPELLVRRRGEQVESIVLAGTAAPDEASGEALLRSEKDREEHAFARDSAVASLSPLLAMSSVDPEPWLLRLDNLQHLATRITGELAAPTHVLGVVEALHPTAAVGGSPRDVAVPRIAALERMDRGRYTGPIGVVDGRGDGTFGIALRCAQVTATRARLFAGNGIVAGSLPEAELEETRLKLGAMQTALAG